MLVLTRKQDEAILVILPDGNLIELRIARIENDRIKLGIDAPQNIRIFRKEVYDTILQSNTAAQCNTEQTDKNKIMEKLFKNFPK